MATTTNDSGPVAGEYAKILSTCDLCRRRKLRCTKKHLIDDACSYCMSRGVRCYFSLAKQRKSRQSNHDVRGNSDGPSTRPTRPPHPPASETSAHSNGATLQTSEASPETENLTSIPTNEEAEGVVFHRRNKYISSCGLTFFSENNLADLANRLGHDRVRELLNEFGTLSRARQFTPVTSVAQINNFDAASVLETITPEARAAYLHAFATEIYPIWPFLDWQAFEEVALGRDMETRLRTDRIWAMLYCAILSLGILAREPGCFRPMEGPAWNLFIHVLRSFPNLLFMRNSMISAQTLTAMAIFATNHSSWSVEELFITEAARIAVALHLNKQHSNLSNTPERQRLFWVIYCLEKEYCFHSTQSSVFNDVDINCPVPETAPSLAGGIDWLQVQIDLFRILSSAYINLFSTTSRGQRRDYHETEIRRTRADLERWRLSIPEEVRPGHSIRPRYLAKPHMLYATIHVQLIYYVLQIAMCRLLIHVYADQPCASVAESKIILMKTTRMVVEALTFIPIEPLTSMNILSLIPIAVTFILFDLVIYNPEHSETAKNLMYLDVAAGYFQRVHIVTESTQRGHLLAGLTHIARDYVNRKTRETAENNINAARPHDGLTVTRETPVFEVRSDFSLNHEENCTPIPEIEVDEFPGNDYMDLLQYPVVDSLIGLEGFDNEDLGTSNIFGQSILYNMSNVHDG